MKIVILSGILLASLPGCASPKTAVRSSPLRSEREYAAGSEALAQDLYKTGQATDLGQARSEAAAAANEEWARGANAAKKNAAQKEFEKKLKKGFSKETR